MAVALTAPVPVTHSGEVDPALYPQVSVGNAFPDFVATIDTSGGNVDVTISGENLNASVTVRLAATLLAFTTAGKLTFIPGAPGLYTVTLKDVTSGSVASVTIEVFSSEGL